jgi:hypothetical protein
MPESLYHPELRVFLVRIKGPAFGFRVVAVCADTAELALCYCENRYGGQRDVTKPNFMRIEHSCRAAAGIAATFEYEE